MIGRRLSIIDQKLGIPQSVPLCSKLLVQWSDPLSGWILHIDFYFVLVVFPKLNIQSCFISSNAKLHLCTLSGRKLSPGVKSITAIISGSGTPRCSCP